MSGSQEIDYENPNEVRAERVDPMQLTIKQLKKIIADHQELVHFPPAIVDSNGEFIRWYKAEPLPKEIYNYLEQREKEELTRIKPFDIAQYDSSLRSQGPQVEVVTIKSDKGVK